MSLRAPVLVQQMLLFAVAACGGDDGVATTPDAGPDAGPAGALDYGAQYCAQIAATICDGTAACGCVGAATDAACTARVQRQCEGSLAAVIGLTVLGYLEFVPDRLSECVAEVRAVAEACVEPTFRNQPAACDRAFVDRAMIGATCSPKGAGLACAAGAGLCKRDGTGGPATCHPPPQAGDACVEGRCGSGLACVVDTCVAPATAGQPCQRDEACALDLVCGASATCVVPAAAGEPCVERLDCATGLVCDAGTCVAASPLGEACATVGDNTCGTDRACQPTGEPRTCQPRFGAGQPCGAPDDCASGLTCDFSAPAPSCRTLPGAGETCWFSQCASGLGCDGTDTCVSGGALDSPCIGGACAAGAACYPDPSGPPTCRAPGGLGFNCAGNQALCTTGLFCSLDDGSCVPTAGVGQACQLDAQCGPGNVCRFDTSGGTCAPQPSTVGAPCDGSCGGDLRCAPLPGQCVGGACVLRG